MVNSFACNHELLECIKANLEQFTTQNHQDKHLKQAAVAITLVDAQPGPGLDGVEYHEAWAGHAAIILTKRAARLRKHAGQWALPGGRIDAGETPEEAALRELAEEVDLRLSADRVIGRLDDYSTRSGFTIKPVVVWGGTNITLTANPDEVASIHRIPLAEFMRKDVPILEPIPESEYPVLKMPLGDSWFAAPTAAMIYQFREVALLGKSTRVAHFEQPYFAWR